MHCLGAVAGSPSTGLSVSNSNSTSNSTTTTAASSNISNNPSNVNNNSNNSNNSVVSVVRALGVLVCEGRIQGSPRGYKEGPHCSAPLQSVLNQHECDKDNYLCNRYLVLIKEIAERIETGTSLCVEVLMCSDCPCGLGSATCKDPISSIPSTITQWPHSCELLLEYWRIGVVPSKSSEMMNSQGLYQAVRSRLHFSQIAAWWSRSNGNKPAYVATRVVPHKADNLKKFYETPVEHTFPLASIGDGNSIEIIVWALPRMEDVPALVCPVHLEITKDIKEDKSIVITPTKNTNGVAIGVVSGGGGGGNSSSSGSSSGGGGSGSSRPDPTLVLPLLVDDRLQTPCNKSGKHHCRCEDEDGCPPSPSIKPNGERKRRRSLPCGPPDVPSSNTFNNLSLASVVEAKLVNETSTDNIKRNNLIDNKEKPIGNSGDSTQINGFENRSYLNTGTLERKFQIQVNLDIPDCKEEKRYKPSSSEALASDFQTINNSDNNICNGIGAGSVASGANKSKFFVPFIESQWPSNESHNNEQQIKSDDKKIIYNETIKNNKRLTRQREPNLIINPFSECNTFNQDSNNSCSSSSSSSLSNNFNQQQHQPIYNNVNSNSNACTLHLNYSKSKNDKLLSCKIEKDDVIENYSGVNNSKELSHLMSKLSFNKDIDDKNNTVKNEKDDGGIFDWISKVPGRVLNGTTNSNQSTGDGDKLQGDINVRHEQQHENHQQQQQIKANSNTVKFKNCNLELSQREFDEVLAVLRAKTPSSRRRGPVKNVRKRERCSDIVDKNNYIKNNDVISLENCLCPIHREIQRSINPFENTICQLCTSNNTIKQFIETSELHRTPIKSLKKSNDNNNININNNSSNNIVCDDVQNKADVLLNAILRTSNQDRKGLSDISNGTRPRNNSNKKKFIANVDSTNEQQQQQQQQQSNGDPTIKVPIDDEKYLPAALNKRLHRFKQLFRKDQQYQQLQDRKELNDIYLINKVKRKIDFTTNNTLDKFVNTINYKVKNETESIDQGIINNNSTNYKLLNNHHEALINKDSSTSSVNYGNKYLHDNVITINDEDEVSNKKNNILEKPIINDHMDDDSSDKGVPSAIEQERFRRSLENATSMVFHSRTGLPLTSSPAPLRRGSCCFDYDSTLNTASSKRSALFELNTPPSPGAVSLEETDREIENSVEGDELPKRSSSSRIRPQSHALLGSFEESALNGRLEPVSTVHGFTAEIGASGTFCPKHRKLPVTVFFYTLNDIDKVSTPYLAHINLGKKGYQVPRSGTIQVTLFNPLGTVVKMFVVLYDLSDMPARSHTFLRQRTLRDKTLRYLIHLRFMSGKSGRIYLHTDIRIIICRKSDVDTASDFGSEPSKELRSYIHGPTNPKFSPRC